MENEKDIQDIRERLIKIDGARLTITACAV